MYKSSTKLHNRIIISSLIAGHYILLVLVTFSISENQDKLSGFIFSLGFEEWGVFLQAVALAITVIFSFIQITHIQPMKRTRLKIDMEILNGLDKKHPQYPRIKKIVDERVEDIYSTDKKHHFVYWSLSKSTVYNSQVLAFSMLMISLVLMFQFIILQYLPNDYSHMYFWVIFDTIIVDYLLFRYAFLFAFSKRASEDRKEMHLKSDSQLRGGLIVYYSMYAYLISHGWAAQKVSWADFLGIMIAFCLASVFIQHAYEK